MQKVAGKLEKIQVQLVLLVPGAEFRICRCAAKIRNSRWRSPFDRAYGTTHYSLPLLAADAHLVFLGAMSERLRWPGLAAYTAAKVGLAAGDRPFLKDFATAAGRTDD